MQKKLLATLQKWGDYEAYGGAVAPTNFVPMKTPLAVEILRNWNLEKPPRFPLSVAHLLQTQLAEGRKIGMIIDLSNHETLYGGDLKELDVLYKRVPVRLIYIPRSSGSLLSSTSRIARKPFMTSCQSAAHS